MRIEKLQLLAFGPFTDTTLALASDGAPGLHIVSGNNETGKSTALRAANGLLFGIPVRTEDAHLHPMKKLRVGATLVANSGETYVLVRKKGNKNTLLDADGKPVDEELLRRLLSNVAEAQFGSMFGLNHESLRAGASELLASGGDLGQALYGASLGAGIHTLLGDLETEAKALFSPRGSKPELNAAIAEYKHAQRQLRAAGFSPEAYLGKQAELEEANTALNELKVERGRLHADQGRIGRARRVIPLLNELDGLVAKRVAMGAVPSIEAEAIESRLKAEETLKVGTVRLESLRADAAKLDLKKSEVPATGNMAEIDEAVLASLTERLGIYRNARLHIPKREAERAAALADANRLAGSLGSDTAVQQLHAALPSVAERAALEELGQIHAKLVGSAENATERLRDAQDDLESAPPLPPDSRDLFALTAAVESARKLGNVSEQLATLHADCTRLEAKADRAAKRLSGFEGSAENASSLPVPGADAIERRAAERNNLSRRIEKAKDAQRLAEQQLANIEAELDSDERDGALPTEELLQAEREHRDHLWSGIRGWLVDATKNPGKREQLASQSPDCGLYESTIKQTDATADVMRKEAARVANRSQLSAQRHADQEAVAKATGQVEQFNIDLEAHDDATQTLWSDVGVEASRADEMPQWALRHQGVMAEFERANERRVEHVALAARMSQSEETLAIALSELEITEKAGQPTFDQLLAKAERFLTEARVEQSQRDAADKTRRNLEKQITKYEGKLASCESNIASWQTRWAPRVLALGLAAHFTPTEVQAVLSVLQEFDRKMGTAIGLEQRIAKMTLDADAFEADVDGHVAAHAPELASHSLSDRASALVDRLRQAHQGRVQLDALSAQLADNTDAISVLEQDLVCARTTLEKLCTAFDVNDAVALRELEVTSRLAHAADVEIRAVRAKLLEAGDRLPEAQLRVEAEGKSTGEAQALEADIAADLKELNDDIQQAAEKARSIELELQQYEGSTSAADAANEAAAALARVQACSHRFVRLKLAAHALRAEINRYRDANQGPVLERANDLFPRLTLGAFRAIRVGFGDSGTPVLTCVRAGGEELNIDDLSDGTKDQLYLALRLATLLRFAEHNEPLPLILDDCLVHFDDDRARAALEVLGEVSKNFQVIFFTHHSKLVELAEEAVPPEQLQVCDLGEIRAGAARTLEAVS